MRVTIDFEKCDSHAVCALTAPKIFWVDDHGYTQFDPAPDEAERENAVRAAQQCPAQAIQIVENREAGCGRASRQQGSNGPRR
ncbi:ferredoxin [Prauserella sp. PE36]|uniref:ferredoxin n=1 Tax=Prauserella sp. PE36 TaxID=1504709 RepID=UPI000DE1CB11|nr:ferredoxin [Prauserella sp. PE36]RBM15264.1 ferredoxin [Prauserella sp. PE36]